MNILKWVHKWTWFLQFHPFRWNVMTAHSSTLELPWSEYLNQKYKYQSLQNHICLKLPVFVVIFLKNLDNFTKTCMILTQTWAIGLLINSHTVKHANCYGSSHYFLKILFINHTYKIQTKQGQSVAYPLA